MQEILEESTFEYYHNAKSISYKTMKVEIAIKICEIIFL